MVLTTSAPIGYRPDLFIHGRDNEFIVLVEVKNPSFLSRSAALALYSDIAERITVDVSYFLLLSQQLGFLWRRKGETLQPLIPTAEFPMKSVMARYAPALAPGERLRGRELDYVVFQWLSELTEGTGESLTEPEDLFANTGFLSSIQGGSVVFETGIPEIRGPSLL